MNLLLALLALGAGTACAQTVLHTPLPELAGVYTMYEGGRASVAQAPGAPLDVDHAWLTVWGWAQPGWFHGDGVECDESVVEVVAPSLWARMPPLLLPDPYWSAVTADLSGSFQVDMAFQPHWGATWDILEDGQETVWLGPNNLASYCLVPAVLPVAVVDSVVLHIQLRDAASPDPTREPQLDLEAPWPNPGNGAVTVAWEVPRGVARLSLHDLAGVRLREWPAPGGGRRELRIDTSGLASGIYLVALDTGAQRQVRRLAVVR